MSKVFQGYGLYAKGKLVPSAHDPSILCRRGARGWYAYKKGDPKLPLLVRKMSVFGYTHWLWIISRIVVWQTPEDAESGALFVAVRNPDWLGAFEVRPVPEAYTNVCSPCERT